MSTPIPFPSSRSRPVVVLASTVAGASALTGVLAAVPEVPRWLLIVLAGVTAVGSAVGGVITNQRTAPWEDVAALRVAGPHQRGAAAGPIVAGPASDVRTGAAVEVSPTSGMVP